MIVDDLIYAVFQTAGKRKFEKKEVTLLAGVKVLDCSRVLNVISQGGGALNLGEAVQQVFYRLKGGRI